MNKLLRCCMLLCCLPLLSLPCRAIAQVQEAKQLALDIAKLSELKKILQNMYNGYTILVNGYNKVKAVTSGSYSLHEAFLDGLLAISPEVRRYQRIADIIRDEGYIISEYKSAFARFKADASYRPEEIRYMAYVYSSLMTQTIGNVNELLLVITAGEARMSDGERLETIDRIYSDTQEKLSFLRSFNRRTEGLSGSRQAGEKTTDWLRKAYDLNN